MIVRDSRRAYRLELKEQAGGDKATADSVLDCMFGSNYSDKHDYFVVSMWGSDGKTVAQRLNMFWVMPLTLLLAPAMYLKNGQVGWSTRSKAGRFVLRITGHMVD